MPLCQVFPRHRAALYSGMPRRSGVLGHTSGTPSWFTQRRRLRPESEASTLPNGMSPDHPRMRGADWIADGYAERAPAGPVHARMVRRGSRCVGKPSPSSCSSSHSPTPPISNAAAPACSCRGSLADPVAWAAFHRPPAPAVEPAIHRHHRPPLALLLHLDHPRSRASAVSRPARRSWRYPDARQRRLSTTGQLTPQFLSSSRPPAETHRRQRPTAHTFSCLRRRSVRAAGSVPLIRCGVGQSGEASGDGARAAFTRARAAPRSTTSG